ncbi:hypothetical protein WJX73_008545 [Symbiochloris irregularis]|uniref:Uncharacterized protein n=1 Tax=Symbiochloris irregularis TaxID=706552 RepID=A0AAW1P0J4_9CHLO
MRGAQPGKQARWAILAGSGLPTFKRRLASGFEQVPLALPTLNESARAEVVRLELVACKHASDVDATAIVADPGIKSLLDFTLGLPGALAVILQELSQLATRSEQLIQGRPPMSLRTALRNPAEVQRLQLAVRDAMQRIIMRTDDVRLPHPMELAAAVLMPFSGLAFSEGTLLSSGRTLQEFMSDSAILVPQFIERDAAWASLDATWSLLMAPDWACYIAGTLRRQGLGEAANSALDMARGALDLDATQRLPGLPWRNLIAAGILANAFLCSGLGLAKIGDFPEEMRLDWQDCRHLFALNGFGDDSAALGDFAAWVDMTAPGKESPTPTLCLYQAGARGSPAGASSIAQALATYDEAAEIVARTNKKLPKDWQFDFMCIHLTTAKFSRRSRVMVRERPGLLLRDHSSLPIWMPPAHQSPALWGLNGRRQARISPRALAMRATPLSCSIRPTGGTQLPFL